MPFETPKTSLRSYTPASKNIFLFCGGLFLLGGLFFLAAPAFAQTQGIVPCGNPGQAPCNVCDLYTGIRRIINFLLTSIALPVAVIAVLAAGLLWLTSGGSESRVAMGKEILWYAVIGIIVAFAAWVIVNTLLDTLGFRIPISGANWFDYNICQGVSFDTGAITPPQPGPPAPPVAPPGLPPGTLSHQTASNLLIGAGIQVVSSSGNLGCNNLGCTTLEGIPASAITKIIQAKQNCNCSFVISGGTETVGHGPTTEHGPGKGVIDAQVVAGTSYTTLETAFQNQSGQTRCEASGSEAQIPCNSGNVNHIHVRFP